MTLNTASGQPTPMKDGEFVSTSQSNHVTFGLARIAPPSDLYVQRDDVITYNCITGLTGGVVLTITARLLRADDNSIVTIQKQLRVPTTYTQTSDQIQLAEGYLLSITAFDDSSASAGLTYVSAFLQRGGLSFQLTNAGFVLFADWVTRLTPLGWPGGRQMRALDGPGLFRVNTVANPAAGADWTITVPILARWELVAIQAQLVTSAAVANRVPHIIGTLGGTNIWTVGAASNIVASTTAQATAMQTSALAPVLAGEALLAIPPRLAMPGASIIQSFTTAIQAADQWSNIRVSVREWLDV